MGKYPLPVSHFIVDWGGNSIGFTEVSGLSMEHEVIEYREGSSPDFSATKMPGLRKFGNITLKRGIIQNDNDFFNWCGDTNTIVSKKHRLTYHCQRMFGVNEYVSDSSVCTVQECKYNYK